MEASIECTHCRVVMTSWSPNGSPVRYYQCPFCARTLSSQYGEVFRRRAGARVVPVRPERGQGVAGAEAKDVRAPARATRPSELPMPSHEDLRWAGVKSSAARWFARLEEDQRRSSPPTLCEHDAAEVVPEIDPADVVELAPALAAIRRG